MTASRSRPTPVILADTTAFFFDTLSTLSRSYKLSRLKVRGIVATMAETINAAARTRQRRSDAQRSIDAIVSAAGTVLGERPDASMEEIAAAAGLTRQTVYAHFPSRDVLIAAVINAARAESLAAIDAARLDSVAPLDALRRFLDISWQLVDRCPLLLDLSLTRTLGSGSDDPHRAVGAHLERIIRRGQRSGDFDRALPADWLAAATLGLSHTAAEKVAIGRLTTKNAATMLLDSVLRLYGAHSATTTPTQPAKE
jgi:AcrR family transcriptional regulator